MVTQSHFSEIFAELFKFREDGFMCDTVIMARDKRLDAHGLLLAAASPVFKSAFQTDDRPGQHFVNLSHVDSAVMEIALHFIYTGKLLLPHVYTQTNELPKLFASLHRLGLEPQKLNGCEMRFKSPEESGDYQLPMDNQDNVYSSSGQDSIESRVLQELGESASDAVVISRPPVQEHGSFELDVLTELVNGNAVAESLSPSMQSVLPERKEDEEFEQESAERAAEALPMETRKRRKAALASDQKRNSLIKNNLRTKGRRKWQIHLLSSKAKRANRFTANDDNAKMISLLTGMKYGRVKTEPSAQDCVDFGNGEVCLLQSSCVKEEIASEATEMGDVHPGKYPDKRMLLFLISSSEAIDKTQSPLQQPKPSKKHPCFVCSKVCKTRSKLEQHLLIHTGEKPHVCLYCNKGFANKSNLDRHVKMHTGIRPHLCDLCGKGFIQKTSLLDHMLIHYEAKAYKCTVCGLTYNRKTNLQQHFKRLHQSRPGHTTGETGVAAGHDAKRPFLCDLCGRGFATVVTLKFHKKLHAGEKPFACSICSKSFVQKTQLDQHFRIHTGVKPYICQTCGKSFVYKDSLTQHTRIHTGEKPYVCQICSKAYTQSHHLKGHMLTHTGEKPYACQLCNKSYKNRADLRFHSTRVHQVNLPKLSKNNF